jgi:hypothetical protein
MEKPREVIHSRRGVYALRKKIERIGKARANEREARMLEAAEYRRFAQMCVENAEIAPSEGDRTAMLSLAQHWLQLASEAEGWQPATSTTRIGVHTTGADGI